MRRLSAGLFAALIAIQPPAFRTGTDLVALAVTVVDADGRLVQGLGKDAFSLTEDDRPQPIAQFAGDTVPLSLAIALDASTSMKGRPFEYARDAVWRLLDHLALEDEVCVRIQRSAVRRRAMDQRCSHDCTLAPRGFA